MPKALRKQAEKTEKTLKFAVDLSVPIDESLFSAKEAVEFFKSNIKVNNKKGNLKEHIVVSLEDKKVVVKSTIPFSKRYLKYLSKKFLKSINVLEYLRVIASDKLTYKVKFVNEASKTDEAADK